MRNVQISTNTLREGVVVDLGVENQIKWRVLVLIASRRVRMESNSPLVLQEVVIFSSVFKPLRGTDTITVSRQLGIVTRVGQLTVLE